jgi:hypothetical protein
MKKIRRIYAGIGSRETPDHVLSLMNRLSLYLESVEWGLRSGGAKGADTAFENGVTQAVNKSIYLPAPEFNGRRAGRNGCIDSSSLRHWPRAMALVDKYHPDPKRLSPFARKLMARNSFQVLGPNLSSPASCIICWTRGGEQVGGTSQAIRIAINHGIMIRNLGIDDEYKMMSNWLDRVTEK